MIKLFCKNCGIEFYMYPSANRRFCSRKCSSAKEFNPFTGKHHTEKTKGKIGNSNRGKLSKENHPNWKGGIRHGHDGGYIRYTDGKYIHRAVMEEKLGRKLLKDEFIHHINGDPSDNRIENLELTNNSNHRSTHIKNQSRDCCGRFTKGE